MSDNNESKQGERIIVRVDAELEDIIPGFLEDWKEEVRSMRESLENNDYEPIRIIGHNMKGTAGACGFHAVTDMGADLEAAAKGKDTAVMRKTLDSLSSYFENVEVVYEP